jgi:hypothetical protein
MSRGALAWPGTVSGLITRLSMQIKRRLAAIVSVAFVVGAAS